MMDKRPLIGISASLDFDEQRFFVLRSYCDAIYAAGGVPLTLYPALEEDALCDCLDGLDGLMLAGGGDVAPALYGQTSIVGLGEVTPLRDDFEMRLVRRAVERDMPTLGICRGLQAMNVALGGSLYQDLCTQYPREAGALPMQHSQTSPGLYPSHEVSVPEDSLLYTIEKSMRFAVNSFHHQAVWKPADGLRVCALAENGVIEGLERTRSSFMLGVQWHPERMFTRDERALALFKAFVEASRKRRA